MVSIEKPTSYKYEDMSWKIFMGNPTDEELKMYVQIGRKIRMKQKIEGLFDTVKFFEGCELSEWTFYIDCDRKLSIEEVEEMFPKACFITTTGFCPVYAANVYFSGCLSGFQYGKEDWRRELCQWCCLDENYEQYSWYNSHKK